MYRPSLRLQKPKKTPYMPESLSVVTEAREIARLAFEIEGLRKKYERAHADLLASTEDAKKKTQEEIRAEIAKIDRQFVADMKKALVASGQAVLKTWEADMAKTIKEMKETTASAERVFKHIQSIKKGDKGDKPIVGIDFPFPQDGRDPDEALIASLMVEKLDKSLPIERTARGLENLPDAKKMTKKAIYGLEEELRNLASKMATGSGGKMRGGGDNVEIYDLSSVTDGSTKVFTVPHFSKAICVIGSDFPSVLFLNNGFTVNAAQTQVTLTPTNAPSSGSQLGFLYAS